MSEGPRGNRSGERAAASAGASEASTGSPFPEAPRPRVAARRPLLRRRALSREARSLVVSYRQLRRMIGGIGLLLPLVLGPVGLVLGIEIQDTMSDYYHTPLQDYFVGSLVALAALLVCYRGHGRVESWTANVAAAAAIGLAAFPLDHESDPLAQGSVSGYLHTISGGVFFCALGVYSLWLFPRGDGAGRSRQRRFIYRTTGIALVGSVASMGAIILLGHFGWRDWTTRYDVLFWLEWLAVWAFSTAWLTKGRAVVTELAASLLAWAERGGRR